LLNLRTISLSLVIFFFTLVIKGQELAPPEYGTYDSATLEAIDLMTIPLLPELTEEARLIFERGQDSGRNPAMFSKVGDSMTASESFLVGFGRENYDLADYPDLQTVVDFVVSGSQFEDANAFNRQNYATELGFSTVSALDPTWAIADECLANETPLICEYRVSNAAFALMMFGTNDVTVLDAENYDYFLRTVVIETINQDLVPILYTFPIRADVPEEKSITFNKIIVSIANDYDLPLVNLYLALIDLPNYGVQLDDPLHLTLPDNPDDVFTFNDETLQAGYTIRNLMTLQSLDIVLRGLDVLDEKED
jgi:hypothetical protein